MRCPIALISNFWPRSEKVNDPQQCGAMIRPGHFLLVVDSFQIDHFQVRRSVFNRSAIPDAKAVSVSGSRSENFRDELPQLMTRMGGVAHRAQNHTRLNAFAG